jgi:urea carboxylase
MEGPGGYQLVGRTVQVWNTYRSTKTFPPGKPWSLQVFDQIRFYPVSSEELIELRRQIVHGAFELKIEEDSFNLCRYEEFLASISRESQAFRSTQQEAFREERERWRVNGVLDVNAPVPDEEPDQSAGAVPEGCESVNSPMSASVFQVAVAVGQHIKAGAKLVILDAMKTEIIISAPVDSTVEEIRCAPGKLVNAGQPLVVLRTR